MLVVDDEPLVLILLQETLEEAGFQVLAADSYAEAVTALDRCDDGLAGLVTDINLHDGRSGWEIAAEARRRIPTLPVIYVTGDSAHEWPAQGVPQSVVVPKPFAPAQITVALAGLMNVVEAGKLPAQG